MSSSKRGVDVEGSERILVVDDDQIILDLLERVLSREGYQVSTLRRPDPALKEVRTGQFELAIADLDLWRSDGSELMQLIKQASPRTAVVVMTGYPEETTVRFAKEHAQGYLEKPFALEEFLAVVRAALAARERSTQFGVTNPQAGVAALGESTAVREASAS
jgi:DNA-binding NtrC family response regulator